MNFQEEQQVIERLISQLCIFSMQRIQCQSMRDIGIEVSTEGVRNAISVNSVITASREKVNKNIKSLIKDLIVIINEDGFMKGSSYYQPSHNRNKNESSICKNCHNSLINRSKRAKYCSNKCKTAHHRKTTVIKQ